MNLAINESVRLCVPGDAHRAEAETFIADVFKRIYAADVRQFMPVIMSLFDDDEQIIAALGIRRAGDDSLFLETYLDQAVEHALGERLGHEVNRHGIVEIGNLATVSAGGGRLLITALTALLQANGREWAVFTATPLLQRSFHRLGIELTPIAEADPQRLGEARHAWGSYYDQPPTVMAANVDQSASALQRTLELQNTLHAMRRVWRNASSIRNCAAIHAEAA